MILFFEIRIKTIEIRKDKDTWKKVNFIALFTLHTFDLCLLGRNPAKKKKSSKNYDDDSTSNAFLMILKYRVSKQVWDIVIEAQKS